MFKICFIFEIINTKRNEYLYVRNAERRILIIHRKQSSGDRTAGLSDNPAKITVHMPKNIRTVNCYNRIEKNHWIRISHTSFTESSPPNVTTPSSKSYSNASSRTSDAFLIFSICSLDAGTGAPISCQILSGFP